MTFAAAPGSRPSFRHRYQYITSSSAITKRPRSRVRSFWPKVEDWNWEAIFTDIIGLCSTILTASKANEFGDILQVVELSQRDRAAGWVSYGQKCKTGTGKQYFTDIVGLSSTTVTQLASRAIEFGEKKRKIRTITPFKVIQCYSMSSRSISIESPYATSY